MGQTSEVQDHRIRNDGDDASSRVIRSYDNVIVRAYCTVRFSIINMRILEELEQYLPRVGRIIDLGCGFGLFSLFFALKSEGRRILSFDLNLRRIEMARRAGKMLGISERTEFIHRNVLDYAFDEPADAVVTLDLFHHIPTSEVPRILSQCYKILTPGGILLVKDITARPLWKAAFTWVLDKLMDLRAPVHYYHEYEIKNMLAQTGFSVRVHHLLDILPYPHVLYVCTKPPA